MGARRVGLWPETRALSPQYHCSDLFTLRTCESSVCRVRNNTEGLQARGFTACSSPATSDGTPAPRPGPGGGLLTPAGGSGTHALVLSPEHWSHPFLLKWLYSQVSLCALRAGRRSPLPDLEYWLQQLGSGSPPRRPGRLCKAPRYAPTRAAAALPTFPYDGHSGDPSQCLFTKLCHSGEPRDGVRWMPIRALGRRLFSGAWE